MSYIGDVGRLDSTINSDFSKYTYEYIATEGQTVFTGTDINSATLGYTAGNVLVTYGGLDIPQSDYTATDGVSIVLTDPAIAGEIVRVIAFQAFEVADAYTKIQSDDLLATKAPLASPSFTGNVGIGTNSQDADLHIVPAEADINNPFSGIRVSRTPSLKTSQYGNMSFANGALSLTSTVSGSGGQIKFLTSTNGTSASETMRINSAGQLLLGKTAFDSSIEGFMADSRLFQTTDGLATAYFNRLTSDGNIVEFRKGGATIGTIGVKSGTYPYIGGNAGGSGDVFLVFISNTTQSIRPATSTGADRDNAIDLGSSSTRFDDIYATNGTIQTSDRNEKQDIIEITAAETAVAKACKGLLRSFRWKSAVEKKGDDARIHFGIIAQDLQDAFTAEGLDAGRYAMFMSNTWWEAQTEVPAVEAVDEVTDEDGNITTEAVEAKDAYTRTDTFDTLAEAPAGATERTRLGVRYTELLAFIIAAL